MSLDFACNIDDRKGRDVASSVGAIGFICWSLSLNCSVLTIIKCADKKAKARWCKYYTYQVVNLPCYERNISNNKLKQVLIYLVWKKYKNLKKNQHMKFDIFYGTTLISYYNQRY